MATTTETEMDKRARRRALYDKEMADWTDDELVDVLTQLYEPTKVPPCRVCGGELTIQAFGGGEPTERQVAILRAVADADSDGIGKEIHELDRIGLVDTDLCGCDRTTRHTLTGAGLAALWLVTAQGR